MPADTPSFRSTPAPQTEGNRKEEKASEPYDPYDIYCNVLDEAEAKKDLADEILLDDAWFCNEMLDSPGNHDPNIGLLVNITISIFK